MTNRNEFSLDITVNPASGFKPLPDLVVFDLCRAYPISDGNLLLLNARNNKRTVVMPEVYASLLSCNRFQTLDKHVANIIALNPGMQGQQSDIRNVLQNMLNNGMMISAKSVTRKLRDAAASTRPDDNSSDTPVVAVTTWERPEALERLLKSINANCDTSAFHRLYVIDDSRDAANISKNQSLVKELAPAMETPVQYFGRAEQQSLLDKLVKHLPDHEQDIRFLADQSRWADHWTSGMARNLALLLSCGHRLVMMDDDTVCDVYESPQPKPGISFSDEPREADFFSGQQEWASLRQPLNPDPVKRHMQCLGLSFSEALNVLGENNLKPNGLADATALMVNELDADSPVLMTECGSLGCPGTNTNTWLPDMAPVSLNIMLISENKTTNALGKRHVWSGRSQPHFTPRPNMSQITGFDNRQMLPPYLPINRGEDRLFGFMLDFLFPASVTLDYPWAIPHLPLPEREWRNRDLDFTPGDSFPAFFFERVLEFKPSCQAATGDGRLTALSAWFDDMASASPETLTAMHRDARLRGSSEQLQHLGALLSEAKSAPVNWQNYLRNGMTQLNKDLDRASREDFPVKGSPSTMEGEPLIDFWKGTWAEFASALKAWPEIRNVARNLVDGSD